MIETHKNSDYIYDAIVVGIGHAGVEAALALARKGHRTLALSITLDNAGYLACNPSIGGTAKGHLVREVDALGGEMGKAADKCLTHLRMLNSSKGPAVHSLRAQIDKYKYHNYIKNVLETTPNLFLRQGEVKNIIVDKNIVVGLETTTKLIYKAKTVVLACGVYLDSTIIIGDVIEPRGPVCFSRSNYLASSLKENGIEIRRFKTGTPARVKRSTVDLDKLEVQGGEDTPYSFSCISKEKSVVKKGNVCFLGYTNLNTHDIIRENLSKSPKYSGLIHGTGARYCPSVEDKIVRFSDKDRHQFFLEPEGEGTEEMYVQGLSTGLPSEVQLDIYRSVEGFSNVQIMRDAYAIEYECINPLQLFPTLMCKNISGLFFAGQINGTSGYEEAAAQGLVAGINAALFIEEKPPMILTRDVSYTGVLIDDLCTKGADEPYRMMTSRAEFRLLLRQDNADIRLTTLGREVGLVDDFRWKKFQRKLKEIEKAELVLKQIIPLASANKYLTEINEQVCINSPTIKELIKRSNVNITNFCATFDNFSGIDTSGVLDVFIETRYAGYLERERRSANEAKRVEKMPLAENIDYMLISGLRSEAKEKLNKVRPLTIGQASRISGVSPADINILIIRLGKVFK